MTFEKAAPNKLEELRMGFRDGLFTLETCVYLPRPREDVFTFFADARNLEIITPPWLQFKIQTALPIDMHAGTLIEYQIRLHGVPMRWQTEISVWEPPFRFVDEQQRGPYRRWIHEHTFTPSNQGCEMRDFVCYSVPGGRLANRLFVQRDIRKIFEYRAAKLRDLFTRTNGTH